jgi:hypothetical protein
MDPAIPLFKPLSLSFKSEGSLCAHKVTFLQIPAIHILSANIFSMTRLSKQNDAGLLFTNLVHLKTLITTMPSAWNFLHSGSLDSVLVVN